MRTIPLSQAPSALLDSELRGHLEREVFPEFLPTRRWFMAKARNLTATRILDATGFDAEAAGMALAIVEVEFTEGSSQRYFVPLVLRGEEAVSVPPGDGILCRLAWGDKTALLRDALADVDSCRALLASIARGQTHPAATGRFAAERTAAFGSVRPEELSNLLVVPGKVEQSHSSVRYGERFLLKAFRKLEAGASPEVEIGRFLTERTSYANVPRTAGVIDYLGDSPDRITICVLQQYVANEGTGWDHALGILADYYSRLEQQPDLLPPAAAEDRPLLGIAHHSPPPTLTLQIAAYLPFAGQLGRRLAELHLALAGDAKASDFAPRTIQREDLTILADRIRRQVKTALETLRSHVNELDARASSAARDVLERGDVLFEVLDELSEVSLGWSRIRVHGDFHLGQVLRCGDDFVILDFEGEPTKSLEERRAKYPAIKDVVGLIRSFDYAAHAALFRFAEGREDIVDRLAPWASAWQTWISAFALRQYVNTVDGAGLLPRDEESVGRLLRAFSLDKALYELDYELNNRPTWAPIPLHGILGLLNRDESSGYEPEND